MISEKDFQAVLDRYLMGENIKGDTDIYINMSWEQQKTINDIKKSLSRIKYKLNKKNGIHNNRYLTSSSNRIINNLHN